jgi:hypothetical protein
MKCAAHPEVDATSYCRNCGKPLCPQCTRDVKGALYCEACLAALVSLPHATAGTGSPTAAAILGFIPGLGAVYNGEYLKALVHVMIFGGLIALMSSDQSGANLAIVIVLFVAFCFYMPVEAYRTANARRKGQPVPGLLDFSEGHPVGAANPATAAGFAPAVGAAAEGTSGPVRSRRNWALGPVILILMGVGFLLANFGLLDMDWLGQYWPGFLIVIGVWLAWKRWQR